MKPLRALIVDDELYARRGLQMLADDAVGIEVVGEATCGEEAVARIRALKPDLVFLDVEMPGLNGIEVVREVGVDVMPAVVFVTAYDQYAVAAFDACAVDYLLKPFTDERFRTALDRVRMRLKTTSAPDAAHLQTLVERLLPDEDRLRRFTVKTGDTLSVFDVDDIDWIEADEYYVKLHIGRDAHLVRQSLTSLEDRLPPDRFARIHRSTIVNLKRIVSLEPLFQGDYTVVLADGQRLRLSRRRREALGAGLTHLT